MKGFIVTAQANREKSAVNESFNIFNLYLDNAYPDLDEIKEKANHEFDIKK